MKKRGYKNEKSLREDIVIFSMIAGILGTIAKTITSGIAYFLNISEDAGFLVAGKIIFHTNDLTLDIGHLIISELTHIGIGALIAIGLSYFYYVIGTSFYLIKGLFYSFFVWVFLRNVLVALAVPGTPEELDLITNIISLSGHLAYGIVTGYVLVKFNHFKPEFKL